VFESCAFPPAGFSRVTHAHAPPARHDSAPHSTLPPYHKYIGVARRSTEHIGKSRLCDKTRGKRARHSALPVLPYLFICTLLQVLYRFGVSAWTVGDASRESRLYYGFVAQVVHNAAGTITICISGLAHRRRPGGPGAAGTVRNFISRLAHRRLHGEEAPVVGASVQQMYPGGPRCRGRSSSQLLHVRMRVCMCACMYAAERTRQ